MDKLKMQSPDAMVGNVAKIAALFPQCVTERMGKDGHPELAVDFDKLREELSADALEPGEERYQFTWPDKKASGRLANTPTTMTLRPCPAESVDFNTTQNLYIEGDNLEVLKILREDYLGAIKMIYIDPPYNTGNDFVYNDAFGKYQGEFEETSGLYDEEGNQMLDPMQRNTEANGRFHTDWLNMIYPRLKVARELLSEYGVIFISIDDNEQDNLRKICDEVFGAQNFIAQLIWQRAFSPKNDARFISNSHDYVIMYCRDINSFKIGRLPRTEEANARYSNPDNDPRGVWMSSDISVKTYNKECDYPITSPSGRVIEPPAGRCWSLSRNAFRERLQDNRIWFGPNGDNTPRIKRFLSELRNEGMAPTSILLFKEVGHSQEGAQELVSLMGDKGVFDGPKPQRLMERLLTLANLNDDSIVLDFFSGSGSMGHAVMKYNADKTKHCKFILVQLPEETDDKAKKAGYENICQIGEERIRRAGKKILEEVRSEKLGVRSDKAGNLFGQEDSSQLTSNSSLKDNSSLPDVGFRVLKLDSSNMEDVFYTPEDFDAKNIFTTVDNVKSDRTPLDLLFQVLPELNIELSAKIETQEVNGKKVFFVDGDYLIATFDTEVNESTVTEIAKMKPQYFVMRDASAENDNVLDNFEQIFKHYSPDTIRRII